MLAHALVGDTGLLTLATVVPETGAGAAERLESIRGAIAQYVESQNVPALVKVVPDDHVADGLIALVRSYGFGPLVPNTVLLGKAETPDDPLKHAELLTVVQHRRCNLVVVHEGEDLPVLHRGMRIDIWWRGHRGNLGLMLALSFLLRTHEAWEDARVIVWRIVESEAEIEPATTQLASFIAEARFTAEVQVVCDSADPFPTIRRRSRQADLLFLGMRPRGEDESLEEYANYYATLAGQTDGLPPTALVAAGEEVDLHRLFAGG